MKGICLAMLLLLIVFLMGAPAGTSQEQTPGNELVVSFTTLAAPKEARKAYEKAGRELNRRQPDFAKVTRELAKAVALYPRFAAAWCQLGETWLAANDLSRSRQALLKALNADPKHTAAYLPLAEIELKLGVIELNPAHVMESARLAEEVLKIDPQLPRAHYLRAVAHSGLGNNYRAKQSIRVVMDSGEEFRYPGVHALLGEIHAAAGDIPSAAAQYQRFLELAPNSLAADKVRERLTTWQARGLIR